MDGTDDAVIEELDDALQSVTSGAFVSLAAILVKRSVITVIAYVLTAGFSANAYGLYSLVSRLRRLLHSVAFGISVSLQRILPRVEGDVRDGAVAYAYGAAVLGTTALGALLYVLAPQLNALTIDRARFVPLLRLLAVSLPFTSVILVASGIFQANKQATLQNGLLRVAYPAIRLLAAVAAVSVLAGGVVSILWGLTFLSIGLAIVAVYGTYRLTSSSPTLSLAREKASAFGSYSLPVTVSIIGTKIQVFGYYPIMALFLTPREVGIFTLGYLLTTFIRWPLLAVNQLLPPIASDLYAREKRQALFKLHQVTSRLIITVALLVAAFAVAYRGPILGIFGETYVQYAWILPVLAVTRLVEVGVGSVGLLLTMTDNERLIAIQNTVGAIFAVGVATGLTAAFGLAGMVVAFATVRIVNNLTQLVMLNYFEGFQPFTRAHLNPVFAVTITALLLAVTRSVLDGDSAIAVGLLFGIAGYALCLRWLGTAPAESRLYARLAPRTGNNA